MPGESEWKRVSRALDLLQDSKPCPRGEIAAIQRNHMPTCALVIRTSYILTIRFSTSNAIEHVSRALAAIFAARRAYADAVWLCEDLKLEIRQQNRNTTVTKLDNVMTMWALAFATGKMVAEAQAVIGYRMLGMAGVWSVTPGENARMMDEKTDAFTQSANAATAAILQGKSPVGVLTQALAPIGKKTESNVKRLSRRGFTKG